MSGSFETVGNRRKNKSTLYNDGIYELCFVRDKGMKSEVVQTNQHSWPERPLKMTIHT